MILSLIYLAVIFSSIFKIISVFILIIWNFNFNFKWLDRFKVYDAHFLFFNLKFKNFKNIMRLKGCEVWVFGDDSNEI